MPSLEKIMQQRDTLRARMELVRMLTELSDGALEYVWRPIAYAYCLTDEHNVEAMTPEDMARFGLIISDADISPDVAREVNLYRLAVCRDLAMRRKEAKP